MSLFSRLFSGKTEPNLPDVPTTFIECLDIVTNWTSRAAIDPDFDMNDKRLHAALSAHVICPYCSSPIKFGHAVDFRGSSLQVQCPQCHTVPRKEKNYDYGAA